MMWQVIGDGILDRGEVKKSDGYRICSGSRIDKTKRLNLGGEERGIKNESKV